MIKKRSTLIYWTEILPQPGKLILAVVVTHVLDEGGKWGTQYFWANALLWYPASVLSTSFWICLKKIGTYNLLINKECFSAYISLAASFNQFSKCYCSLCLNFNTSILHYCKLAIMLWQSLWICFSKAFMVNLVLTLLSCVRYLLQLIRVLQ